MHPTVLYPCKKTRTSLPIFYGCVRYRESTAVVWLLTSARAVNVRLRYDRSIYVVSKALVRLKYGKIKVHMVKVQSSMELFLAPTVAKI